MASVQVGISCKAHGFRTLRLLMALRQHRLARKWIVRHVRVDCYIGTRHIGSFVVVQRG